MCHATNEVPEVGPYHEATVHYRPMWSASSSTLSLDRWQPDDVQHRANSCSHRLYVLLPSPHLLGSVFYALI
jgi:hypothetical protein